MPKSLYTLIQFKQEAWIQNKTTDLKLYNFQARCPFCVCVSKSIKKWSQTDTKVTFHPPPPLPPPENFFWSQMKGMAKIRLFYSGDMALILPR